MPPDPPSSSPADSGDLSLDPEFFGSHWPPTKPLEPPPPPVVGETATNAEILQQMRTMELRIKELSDALKESGTGPPAARLRVPNAPPPAAIPTVLPKPKLPAEKFPVRPANSGVVELGKRPITVLPVLPLSGSISAPVATPALELKPTEATPGSKRAERRRVARSPKPEPPSRAGVLRWLPLFSLVTLLLALVGTGLVVREFFLGPKVIRVPQAAPTVDWSARQSKAEQFVIAFLQSSSVEDRLKFVRMPHRVEPLMIDWYARHASELSTPRLSKITSSLQIYLHPSIAKRYVEVKVQFAEGRPLVVPVEWAENGPVIEWETMVGYSQSALALLPSQSTDEKSPGLIYRVQATLENAVEVRDLTQPLLFRFTDAEAAAGVVRGVWPSDAPRAAELREAFLVKTGPKTLPVTILAQPMETFLVSGEIHLRALVLGWRELEP